MGQKSNLLERALNRFERTNIKNVIVKEKSYPDPDEYLIRVYGFQLALTHQEHSNRRPQFPESYVLTLIYHKDEKVEEFKEETGSFGRIKATYHSIRNKISELKKKQEELEKEKSEKKQTKLGKKIKRLERIL